MIFLRRIRWQPALQGKSGVVSHRASLPALSYGLASGWNIFQHGLRAGAAYSVGWALILARGMARSRSSGWLGGASGASIHAEASASGNEAPKRRNHPSAGTAWPVCSYRGFRRGVGMGSTINRIQITFLRRPDGCACSSIFGGRRRDIVRGVL